jgi:CheY-like chemotaxis protein
LKVKRMARILVIDDDPDMRLMLEQILRPAHHEVLLAADGREGVERCRISHVDLAITDLYMPNQEGLGTIREFRSRWPEVAIIAMSGEAAAVALLAIAQKLGAVEILRKPFSGEELIAAVRRALGSLYVSRRAFKSLWQEYRIYRDRLELQSWMLLHRLVIPARDILAVEVRPSCFSGRKGLIWGVKLDNCDLCRHVLLTRSSGFIKRIGFSPDDPEKFVAVCKSIMSNR